MPWVGLVVRIARSAAAAVATALLAMLAFASWAAVGDAIVSSSPAQDDVNGFATPLLPLGIYVGLLAGVAAFTVPTARSSRLYWPAVSARAVTGGALVALVVARVASFVPAAEPFPLVAATGLATAAAVLGFAWPAPPQVARPVPERPAPRPDVERPRSVAEVRRKDEASKRAPRR